MFQLMCILASARDCGIGGSRSWSWGSRSSAENASRVEAPKAPRWEGC